MCAITLLLAASSSGQTPMGQVKNQLLPAPSCGAVIHLGNDGLIMEHGKPAYSRSGDVWLNCPTGSIQLTRTGDIFSYGIYSDGTRMAVVRHRGRDEVVPALLDEINLRTGQVSKEQQLDSKLIGYDVASTCGTVILFGYSPEKGDSPFSASQPLRTRAVDLATNQELDSANFSVLRCTPDHSVVLRKVGVPWSSIGSLYVGEAGENVLAAKEVGDFNVSPNGQYVAFIVSDSVCITKLSVLNATPTCLGEFWSRGRLSVSNDGQVELTGDSTIDCPCKERVQPPTFTCDAIFIWGMAHQALHLMSFGQVDPGEVSLSIGQKILNASKKWRVSHP